MTSDLHILWTRIRDGDTGAWRELVSLYSDLVYSVALRVGLSQPDAEDCSQQTWLTLYRKRKSLRDPQALPAWLITTTHRNAVALARRFKLRPQTDEFEGLEAPGALPDEELLRLEQQAILKAAIGQLDSRCRKLLEELFFGTGQQSYAELARSLKLKSNSIGSLRGRCLEKLKKTNLKSPAVAR